MMRGALWGAILGILLATAGWVRAERPGFVTVLLYHRFDQPEYPTTNTQVELFRQQLEHLKREGYRVLSIEEFRRLIDAKETFPSKAVLITIDDSHRSIYENAFPVLQEFGYPFVLFTNVSPLYSDLEEHMTWEMVEKMHRAGATIGSHSYFHPRMGRPQKGQSAEEYATWVRRDLRRAQEALSDHGIENDLLAFPFGEYNRTVIEEAEKVGYGLMFTQDEGAVDERTLPTLIPRVAIVGANMTMERFAFKLSLAPLHTSEVVPGWGFMERNPPSVFSLRLEEPERYDPGVVNMFVSELGRVEATYDPKTGRMSFQPEQPLSRSLSRPIVTARERDSGHFSMFSRLYMRPFAELAEE